VKQRRRPRRPSREPVLSVSSSGSWWVKRHSAPMCLHFRLAFSIL